MKPVPAILPLAASATLGYCSPQRLHGDHADREQEWRTAMGGGHCLSACPGSDLHFGLGSCLAEDGQSGGSGRSPDLSHHAS